jgi:hypothetical protein
VKQHYSFNIGMSKFVTSSNVKEIWNGWYLLLYAFCTLCFSCMLFHGFSPCMHVSMKFSLSLSLRCIYFYFLRADFVICNYQIKEKLEWLTENFSEFFFLCSFITHKECPLPTFLSISKSRKHHYLVWNGCRRVPNTQDCSSVGHTSASFQKMLKHVHGV